MIQQEIILLILFLVFIVLYLPARYGHFKKYGWVFKRKKTNIKPTVSIAMSSFLGFFFLIVTVWTALIGFTGWTILFGLIMCYWFWILYKELRKRI